MLCFQNAFAIYYGGTRRTFLICFLVVHYQTRRSPGKQSWNSLLSMFPTCNIWQIIWYLFPSNLFDKVLCFSQPNFQPSTTHKFVMDLALNQFVLDRINFVHIVREHQALGAHTDIIVFRPEAIKTYRWTHPGACPMGNSTSNQCSHCHWLKTLSPKKDNQDRFSLVLKCSACDWERIFKVPDGFQWCQGESPTKGGDRGAWMVFTELIPVKAPVKDGGSTNASGSIESDNMDIS